MEKILALLPEDEVLNIYPYGSIVYGTATEQSDEDYIVIVKGQEGLIKEVKTTEIDLTVYDERAFMQQIERHEISVLECLFLPKPVVVKEEITFDCVLDESKLREAISKKASNSWVKAKKKLEVVQDYDPYIARKSLFHCLRIVEFGIQLAKYNRIENYQQANLYFETIMSNPSVAWTDYQQTYQPIYNQLKTEFKKVCPKKEKLS